MLDAHPEITAIMCGNDQIAVGAITALNLAERKDIIVYGIDGSPDIKKELVKKDSVVAGTVAQSPIHMGKDAAKIALAILKDNEYRPRDMKKYMICSDNEKCTVLMDGSNRKDTQIIRKRGSDYEACAGSCITLGSDNFRRKD